MHLYGRHAASDHGWCSHTPESMHCVVRVLLDGVVQSSLVVAGVLCSNIDVPHPRIARVLLPGAAVAAAARALATSNTAPIAGNGRGDFVRQETANQDHEVAPLGGGGANARTNSKGGRRRWGRRRGAFGEGGVEQAPLGGRVQARAPRARPHRPARAPRPAGRAGAPPPRPGRPSWPRSRRRTR